MQICEPKSRGTLWATPDLLQDCSCILSSRHHRKLLKVFEILKFLKFKVGYIRGWCTVCADLNGANTKRSLRWNCSINTSHFVWSYCWKKNWANGKKREREQIMYEKIKSCVEYWNRTSALWCGRLPWQGEPDTCFWKVWCHMLYCFLLSLATRNNE